MKRACVHAIAELARREASDLGSAYSGETPRFGPEYLIPRPFDPRLLISLAPAVADAAVRSGVAARPIADMPAYREHLSQFVYRTGLLMKPMFDRARADLKRVVFAEGEEETILRAVQTVVDEKLAMPILIGRPSVIESRIKRLNLRLRPGIDFELTNPDDDPRFNDYWQMYHQIMQRKGVSPPAAKAIVRTRSTVIAARMVNPGEADALLCGIVGKYNGKLKHVLDVLGLDPTVKSLSAMSAVITQKGPFFFTDTHVQMDPSAEQIAESALQAAYRLRLFGINPRVALISHSNFGSADTPSARKMAQALEIIRERNPKLEAEGEMHVDAALDPEVRAKIFPNGRLEGSANLLVLPNLDAANTAYNLSRMMSEGIGIGPVLMGMGKPAHVLTPSATVRRVVNMTAIAAVEAQIRAAREK
jgi:malate dehydrogenase (oxaloacetate-decarboxylating)(NADP+)